MDFIRPVNSEEQARSAHIAQPTPPAQQQSIQPKACGFFQEILHC